MPIPAPFGQELLTDIDVANQALAMISARNQITSMEQNNVEAKNVKLFYKKIRNQVMSMAWWNFARKTAALELFKAAPGTPENPDAVGPWTDANPPPPWLYEYRYPVDCLLFRYVTFKPNAQPSLTSTTPLTSAIMSSDSWWPGPPQKFIVANDFTQANITHITNSIPCTIITDKNPVPLEILDLITVSGLVPPAMAPMNGADFRARFVAASGVQLSDPNTLLPFDTTNTVIYPPYVPGVTKGSIKSGSFKVILTNTVQALGCYTTIVTDPNVWPNEFYNAFVTSLAAFIAYPISGSLQLKSNLLAEANGMIIEARKSDGNEGITSQDVVPDWIRVRGLQYQDWWGSGGVGWDQGSFTPYPPLFSVS